MKLARLTADKDWLPGSMYGGNHLYEVYAPKYGDNLVNHQAEVFPFGQAIAWEPGEQKFIKPYQTAKIFTGKVFTEMKWNDFVQYSLENPRTPLLNKDALVQASPPQNIKKEARLWIVGGQIVEAVYYRFNDDEPFEATVAPAGIEFAREMTATFSVAEAFVMDVCLTSQGWKIVEINCIKSAVLYPNTNVKSLVNALNFYFS